MAREVGNFEGGAFVAERQDGIVLVRFKENQMVLSADLRMVEELIAYLHQVDVDDSVRVIVAIGSDADTGKEEYVKFLERAFRPGRGEVLAKRMFNAFDQFLLQTVATEKFVICAARGVVLMDYLGIMLACDYGVYADNVTLANPHLDFGLVPKAGAAYLLSRIAGRGRTYDLLLSEEPVPLDDIIDLGFVDEIVSVAEIEDAAIEAARRFAAKPAATVAALKKLVNYSLRDLAAYLDHENKVLDRLVLQAAHGSG